MGSTDTLFFLLLVLQLATIWALVSLRAELVPMERKVSICFESLRELVAMARDLNKAIADARRQGVAAAVHGDQHGTQGQQPD